MVRAPVMEQPLQTLQVGFHKNRGRFLRPAGHRGGKNPPGAPAATMALGARDLPHRSRKSGVGRRKLVVPAAEHALRKWGIFQAWFPATRRNPITLHCWMIPAAPLGAGQGAEEVSVPCAHPNWGQPNLGVTPIPVANTAGGKLRRHGGKQAQLLRFSLLLRGSYILAANCGLLPGVRLARTSLGGRKTWAGKQIRRRKQHSFPTSRSSQASKFSAGILLLTFYGEKMRLSFDFASTCPSVNPTCALIPTGARAPARRDVLSMGLCRGKAQLEAPDGAC